MKSSLVQIGQAITIGLTYVTAVVAAPKTIDLSIASSQAVTTFVPVANANTLRAISPSDYEPTKTVSLLYSPQDESNGGAVEVRLKTLGNVIALEELKTVEQVDCGCDIDNSLQITFTNAVALEAAISAWKCHEGSLIFVTRHFGNCNTEFERGFFVVDKLQPHVDDRTLRVVATKSSLMKVSNTVELSFMNIPILASGINQGDHIGTHTLSFSQTLPPNTLLMEDGSLHVTSRSASFNASTTISGYINYNPQTAQLAELYFDLNSTFASQLDIDAQLDEAAKHSFGFTPDPLVKNLIDIPGVVQLGPSLGITVGIDVNTSDKVGIRAGVNASMPNYFIHLDFKDMDKSYADVHEPEYHTSLNISGSARAALNPNTSLTTALNIRLFSLDLSTGFVAKAGLVNQFELTPGELDNASRSSSSSSSQANASVKRDMMCGGNNVGLWVKSDFGFDLVGFATQLHNKTLYHYQKKLADYCWEPSH